MGKNYGNAEIKAMGQVGTLAGKVGQHLWPILKPAILSGAINLQKKFTTDAEIKTALRLGFFPQTTKSLISNLNIGNVSKGELAQLSAWDLKNIYPLFYQTAFGLLLDFPDELMPEGPEEFSWPFCIPGVISNDVVFQSGKLDIPRWKWTDKPLDSVLDLNRGRDAWMHSYVGLCRPNWEADEDLKNLSANDIEEKKINVMMLRERLILGVFLFWLTGDHLDRKTITLAGSRSLDGNVPNAYWNDDKLNVDWYNSDDAIDDLRSRQVVS